jgi:Zn-dependent peptidase ImmA (M78 family)
MNATATAELLPRALDPELGDLCSTEWQQKVPLSIKRFVEESGKTDPISAMQHVTDRLMVRYGQSQMKSTVPIVVERLCELSDAYLVGNRPKVRTDGYSIQDHRPRNGHTGKSYFEGQRAKIRIPENLDYATARVAVAHELGHLLIHRRATGYDKATLRLGSTPAEEALAEYCARLLLIPASLSSVSYENLAERGLNLSSVARVTLHSAVLRLGDPDNIAAGVRGAILWKLNPDVSNTEPISGRLTPHWHLCPRAFVPVGKCKARNGSLIAELGDSRSPIGGTRIEEVRIGTFVGTFRIDAFAWGSLSEGSRLVLSVFHIV